MTRSHTKLWVHTVFSTKNRMPLIPGRSDNAIYDYMRGQLIAMDCLPLAINGMSDHIHLLFLQNYKMSLADIMHQVKGSSSFWINKNNIIGDKIGWQDGFGSFSVSPSGVTSVMRYIDNQKVHHQRKTFAQEYDEMLKSVEDFETTLKRSA